LGLDNIGVFDRSAQVPTGALWSRRTDGLDGVYRQNMLEIALTTEYDPMYEETAYVAEHFT
jgi:hypothetical protein